MSRIGTLLAPKGMFTLGRKSEPLSVPGEELTGSESERLARRLWLSFGKGFAAIAIMAAGCLLTSFYYARSSALTEQAHQMREKLFDVRAAMASLDGATVQLLLHRDDDLLTARDAAQQRALDDLNGLRALARESGNLAPAFDGTRTTVQTRIAFDNDVVTASQTSGDQAAAALLRSAKARLTAESLTTNLNQADSAARDLIADRNSSEQWLGRINVMVLVVGCAMALAAIGSAGSAIRTALTRLQTRIADQSSALEHLRGLNETLEERVDERSTAAEQRALELAHAQNSLYRQTRLLRSLLTSMADAVMVCDKQKKLLEINPAAERILGRELRTLPLDQWGAHFDLVDVADGKPIVRADWPLIRAARGEELKTTWLLRQREESRWLEGSAAPIRDDNGAILGAAMVFRDITDRRRAAEELREALDEGARIRALLAAEKQRNAA